MDQHRNINPFTGQFIPWNLAMKRLNFQQRICTTFIPRETNKDCCVCNYQHSKSNTSSSDEIWNWKTHTKQEVTSCYGTLSHSNSPYLRCDIETEPEQINSVLFGVWGLAVPGLIMRMIGDADSTPNMKLEREFLEGVSEAAVASDAWIITNGYKEESISELIGEVVYNARIKNPDINFNAIAVGKWGNIHECHQLMNRYSDEELASHKGRGRYKLELNHTHYIFFDDGTCDSLDTGEFIANLARQMSVGARRRIPLVTVLAGGTLHSLPTICTDLEKLIPVIIVNECGPLSEILCKYLQITDGFYKASKKFEKMDHDEDEMLSDSEDYKDLAMIDEVFLQNDGNTSRSSDNPTLRELLRPLGKFRLDFVTDVRKMYSIARQQEYEAQGKRLPVGELLSLDEERALGKYLYQMASCLQAPFRENIHVFNINLSKSLKESIYHVFLQARDNSSKMKQSSYKSPDEQGQLGFRWGIGDLIENQSVTTAKIWNDTRKIRKNQLLLIDALSKNLLVFVMNFVKLDIDFTILFGPTQNSSTTTAARWSHKYYYLKELYSEAKRKNYDPLYLLDQISSKLNFTEQNHLVIVLRKLVGDFMNPLYPKQSESHSKSLKKDDHDNTQITDEEYIYRDLFLWCILTYRLDMAKIFLRQMKTRICSALIASKILKSLAVYAPDQIAKDTLYSRAQDFETHAIEFVRCAYLNDKYQACELIIRRVDLYGGVTCLQMAFAADDKRFLHEDACQALLTNIWHDKIDSSREQNRLVVNIFTMGFTQFFLSIYQKFFSKYSRVEQVTKSTHRKRYLKSNGIDYTDDYSIDATILKHFIHFHNRPVVKYCYSSFGYVLFLLFFSYYMLFAFAPLSKAIPSIHWTEILTIITVTTMLFEEFRQLFSQDDRSFIGKIRSYFNLKNRISNTFLVLPAYLLFYIGLILRFTLSNSVNFGAARIVMALDLELWFIRSVLFIGIASNLGPKIVMIRKMTNDLLLFITIIVIFILGYGITSRSLTAYGSIDFNLHNFLRDVIYPIYYFVHGSFDTERSQLEAKADAGTTIATHIMFAFHMLFVNILLINLLIALFSFTIADVQTQARYVWAYDRCDIVRTYYARPALFPPFTFLISIVQFCRWCWKIIYRHTCGDKTIDKEQPSCFKMIPIDENVDQAWSKFERYSTNNYIRHLLDDQAAALVYGVTRDITSHSSVPNFDELKRLKYLMNGLRDDLEASRVNQRKKLESMESIVTNLQLKFGQMEIRFDRWNQGMRDIRKSLNWIMTTMSIAKMNESEPPPIIQDPSRNNSNSQKQQQDSISYRSNQELNQVHTPTRTSISKNAC